MTYWHGRTTVGSDGNVMHEAHPVYRREDAGQPQLVTPPEIFFPANVPVPSTNAAFEQFEILRAEAARARDLMLQLARASEGLGQQAASMTNTAQTTRQLQEQLRQLLHTASALSNRVQQLENRLVLPSRPNKP
jgi:ABC-type transporter Mla subunit MlaD